MSWIWVCEFRVWGGDGLVLHLIGLGFGAREVVLWHGGLGLGFGAVVCDLGGLEGGGFGLVRGGFGMGFDGFWG